jgi:hypothetical protein
MKDLFVDSFLIFKYTTVYCHIMCTCNQMRVPFLSRSFLTIIESILDKIQIITPNQRMFLFIFKKKINTYARVKNMYTICTSDDQNIVDD